jgi:adenylosuccinate synthase
MPSVPGASPGSPRRCGWLHLPDIAYSTFINGFTHINLTKLDVLDEEADIPVGIGNNADGTAKFEVLKGWKTSTHGITSLQELPKYYASVTSCYSRPTHICIR